MKVKFVPQNIELEIEPNQSVMKLAHDNGVYIKSVCGGLPSCSECRVRVIEGDQNVLPPSTKELNLIGTGYFIDQRRLSCQLKCFGDVVIDLTEQIAKQATDGPKRPQGSKKEEHEASYAVSGNLIQQDDSLKQVAEEVANNPGGGRGPGGGGQNRGGGQGQNRGGGQNQGGGRNRNRRGGGGQGGGQNRNANQGQNPNQRNAQSGGGPNPNQNRNPQGGQPQGGGRNQGGNRNQGQQGPPNGGGNNRAQGQQSQGGGQNRGGGNSQGGGNQNRGGN
jgi:ferredoxin